MKNIFTTFIFLLLTFTLYAQQPRIQNTQLTLRGDKLFITYDITGTKPLEKVWIEVTKPDGSTITPNTVTGDTGHVTTGSGKKMVWDMVADGYNFGGQEISIEITSTEKKYFKSNKELLYIDKYLYKILNEKDIIYLNNGSEIWGLVTSIKMDKVLIRMKEGNEIQFNVDEIKKIEINQEKKDLYTDSIYLTNGDILNTSITEMKPPEYIVLKIDKSKIKYGFKEIMKVKITCNNETFIDKRDGNIYKYVQIGDQVWMAENLKATEYSDGTLIPNINSKKAWKKLKDEDKAWCYYENNKGNGEKYGILYTWSTAMNYAESSNSIPGDVQGVCPEGWHLPRDEEWEQLAKYINKYKGPYKKRLNLWKETGKHLKSKTGWNKNLNGSDDFGFNAMPGGYRSDRGNFFNISIGSYWWSSTAVSSIFARSRGIEKDKLIRENSYKNMGFSVRCIRD